MKKNELVTIIRKFIKEEVTRQVKQVVSEEMNKQMATILGEVIRKGPAISSAHPLNESVAPVNVVTPARPVIRTNNPLLDEAINSTTGKIGAAPGGNKVSLLNEITKIGESEGVDIAEFLKPKTKEVELDTSSNLNMLKSIVSAGSAEEMPSVLDVPDEINPLAGVFKQDFRSKMRAVNEKAKNLGGGSLAAMVGSMDGPGLSAPVSGRQRLRQGAITESIE